MNLTSSTQSLPTPGEFVDHKEIDWSKVRRTHYTLYQRFRYEYPGPVSQLRQSLVVVPADAHGDQRLRNYHVSVSEPLDSAHDEYDEFGNRVFRLLVSQIKATIDFEIWTDIERLPHPGYLPCLPMNQAARFLTPTRLTEPDEKLSQVAYQLRGESATPHELAERINKWTSECIKYGSDVTSVRTTAAEALALGTGLCQDYAHIMLAVCHEAGLPARYVSGHLLGQGGSHAWVEVLLPDEQAENLVAWAFDPTNKRRAGYNYITVAVGRDFCDVSPVSGVYTAPYQGRLISTKRAGLTFVEYLDGETRIAS